MLKQRAEAEKDAIRKQLEDIRKVYDARKRALQDSYDNERRLIEKKKESLSDEYDAIKDVIDAQRELLDRKKEEEDFNKSLEDKKKSLSDIEAQILALSFDDSAEGIAKRLKLEEEAASIKEAMSEIQADRERQLIDDGLDDMERAAELKRESLEAEIDAEEEAAERRYDIRMRQLEDSLAAEEDALQNKLDAIDKYLDEEGVLNTEAMHMMLRNSDSLYKQLIDWNMIYGTGLREEITSAWDDAMIAAMQYRDVVSSIWSAGSNGDPISSSAWTRYRQGEWNIPEWHTGVERGPVGEEKDEVLAKLTRGEIVFTPNQLSNMMRNLISLPSIPEMTQSNSFGGVSLSMPITVQGTLDEKVLPSLNRIADKVLEKIVDIQKNRGMIRQTSLTSI
jgi:hypothetical protein